MSKWHRFDNPQALDQALSSYLAEKLQFDLSEQGSASLAVSGGQTPRGLFKQLSQSALEWSKVSLTLVDERTVPVTSSDSNEKMVRECLLQNLAAKAQFISLVGTDDKTVSELQTQLLAMPRPYSAVLLGMGADGHTASWFPGAQNLVQLLDTKNPALVMETVPPAAPHKRITQTFSALLANREFVIHITGQDKLDVITSAKGEAQPISVVLEQDTVPVSIWWAP